MDPNAAPLAWISDDIRFDVDRSTGVPVVTILREHTSVESAAVDKVIGELTDGSKMVPLNEAGFQWMAGLIRLAWSQARVAELGQLMAKGRSEARDYKARYFRLSAELYKNQCILDGTPTVDPTWTCGPEPVDDVSTLLRERLNSDAARIKELEAAQSSEVNLSDGTGTASRSDSLVYRKGVTN